jgi:cytochrome c-type biogenesis protein CcmH
MKIFCNLIICLILCLIFRSAFAFSPENHLPETQEKRARELFLQIKCPVCAGQVIESSNAEISLQLRNLVRQKIAEGKSDDEIKADLIKEYGEEILNYPTSNIARYLLWILPFIFIVVGVFVIKNFIDVRF